LESGCCTDDPEAKQHYTELVCKATARVERRKICAMGKAGVLMKVMQPDPNFPGRMTVLIGSAPIRNSRSNSLAARRARLRSDG